MAGVIWEAANETGCRLRFPAGPDAEALLGERKAKDDETFIGRIKDLMGSCGTASISARMDLAQPPKAM